MKHREIKLLTRLTIVNNRDYYFSDGFLQKMIVESRHRTIARVVLEVYDTWRSI